MQADIQKELRIEISLDCFDLFWQSFPLKLIWGYRFIEGASFMPRNVVHQIRIKDAETFRMENNNIGKVSWVSAN